MAARSKMSPEDIADNFATEVQALCEKYNCRVGVWLSWRDMEATLKTMRETPGFDEAEFGLQIRIEDGNRH